MKVKNKNKVPLIITLILVGVCILVCVLLNHVVDNSLWVNTAIKTVASPDGKYQAAAFNRCTGAWGGCILEVSILKPGEKLSNDEGNIFIGTEECYLRDIQWSDDHHLIIRYNEIENDDDSPRLQSKQKGDIFIEYQIVK